MTVSYESKDEFRDIDGRVRWVVSHLRISVWGRQHSSRALDFGNPRHPLTFNEEASQQTHGRAKGTC